MGQSIRKNSAAHLRKSAFQQCFVSDAQLRISIADFLKIQYHHVKSIVELYSGYHLIIKNMLIGQLSMIIGVLSNYY